MSHLDHQSLSSTLDSPVEPLFGQTRIPETRSVGGVRNAMHVAPAEVCPWQRVRRRCARLLGIAVATVAFPCLMGAATMRGSMSDEEIVTHAQEIAVGQHVVLYAHEVSVEPGFLQKLEEGLAGAQKLTGLPLDTATLGPKVRVYVSAAAGASHVWHGYRHQDDPRGAIFLNPRVYREGLDGGDATYLHEFTHLLAWRYTSHTLREGFADYVALKLLPGASIGPLPAGEAADSIPAEILEYLGTTRRPPASIATDLAQRRAYYAACRRFVAFLVEAKGMATFLQLYAAEQPDRELERLYGMPRPAAVAVAFRTE